MSISSLSHPPAKAVGLWPSASRVAGLAWPLGVFVLALLPRLLNLSAQPFWLDEVLTYERASLKPGALMLDSFQNHHMPSFFLMLSPLTHLGHPQFWLRLPSAIFGAIAVMLAFMIAARVAGRLAGVLAALILGLSPMVVAFAQEARSYTLVMTLILVALYGVTLLAQDLPAAGRELKAAKAGWLCFVLGTVAALDVLGDGLPWLLAANLIFAALLPFMQARRGFFKPDFCRAAALYAGAARVFTQRAVGRPCHTGAYGAVLCAVAAFRNANGCIQHELDSTAGCRACVV